MPTNGSPPHRAARISALAVALVALLAWLPSVSSAATRSATPSAVVTGLTWPQRIPSIGAASQVIVVTAADFATSHARLTAWQQRPSGSWVQKLGPIPARLGWNGFVPGDVRRQGSGETPAGVYRLMRGFGLVNPGGVSLPYRVVDANDWWPYDPRDPATYNVLQLHRPRSAQWRTNWAEHLALYRPEYRFAVVLDYNLPSGIKRQASGQRVALDVADTSRGGGIFLHVNGRGPTAGCVSVSRMNMRWLIRWLNPDATPVIAMGPRDWLPGR